MKARAVVLSVLLVGWLLAGSVAFAGTAAANSIDIDNTLAQTPEEGEVDVETQVTIPSGTASLEITLPRGADVYETDGFQRMDDRTYEWTRETNQPSIRYDYAANVTVDRGGGEEYIYAATSEWAIVRTPNPSIRWSGISADVIRENSVDGDGVAGPHITYLGANTEHTREAADQRFRLVVSDHGDMVETPEDVLEALADTAKRLDSGERDPEVLVFVVPSTVEWAATGIQRGDADIWVRDAERLDNPRNTWVHEYVHTRQEYDRTEPTAWTIEGMADYYAALIAYEDGHIDFETFERRMEDGAADRFDDVVLTDPDTWENNRGDYEKGALVFGHLDLRLRMEADSSIDAVIAEFNEPGEELTQERFLDAIERLGNSDIRADAERYSETTATPEVWSREEHVEAFGGPDIRYDFESFAVSGSYRETGLDEPRIVAGETLESTAAVRNLGTREGEYSADFRVDGERVDGDSGTLAPDESTTLHFDHEFDAAGEYEISVGPTIETVVVEAPADIEVTDFAVDPTTVDRGESLTLRATVRSAADRPAEGTVAFEVGGEVAATEQVHVAGSEESVETTITLEEPGEHTISVADHTVTVSVSDETVTPGTETPTATVAEDGTPPGEDRGATPTVGDGSGFGAVAVLLAVVVGLLSVRRR